MHKLLPFVVVMVWWGGGGWLGAGGNHTDIQRMEKENKTHIYFSLTLHFLCTT